MNSPSRELNIVLADDDKDDCQFFKEVLAELSVRTKFTAVHDGEQLMQLLTKETYTILDVLFLDLNMPRKNGHDCLIEIKSNKKLKHLPVIIYSTSYEKNFADKLYNDGANFYIRKPAEFSELKKVIHLALTLVSGNNITQPTKENFLLTGERNETKVKNKI